MTTGKTSRINIGQQAPFPYFGGKSRIAHVVWERFGNVPNYVEPLAGSLAVLLRRPHEPKAETVNDKNGYISNFWRAVRASPKEVARWADWPVNECDLHARHIWLLKQRSDLDVRLMGDPEYYDPKIAGWWVWGICSWIGGGWCAGGGPWWEEGGVFKKCAPGQGINRKRPHLSRGQGINRQPPNLGNRGDWIYEWFRALSDRLRDVRVACGDWKRVTGKTVTHGLGITGVFLDPPYIVDGVKAADLYTECTDTISADVRRWAIENGDNPKMRIAACGYDGEHDFPESWECVAWKAQSGYGNQKKTGECTNKYRERIWFSPHCLSPNQLFD